MKDKYSGLYFPFRLLVFYFIGMMLWRITFIWFNGVPELFHPLWSAIRLDVSMVCGIFLVGFIPFILFMAFGNRWLLSLTMYIHLLLWFFVCVVEFASVLLYKEWGSTLDSRAISYLNHPNEAWASVKDFIPISLLFIGLILLVSGLKRLSVLFRNWEPVRSHYIQSIIFLLFIGPLSFLGLRGGWQKLPIVPSDAFYSTEMKNNFAATNKMWYFVYSITKNEKFELTNSEEDVAGFTLKYEKSGKEDIDSSFIAWKDKNIVFLVAEGWSADMVQYLYGDEHITPFFDSLSGESWTFTNAFSSGFRTDQGLMSLISGIPSIQSLNMPNAIDKVNNYPSLALEMKKTGRNTSFIYGGDLNFSNLYNYLTIMGFDTIISDKDFSDGESMTDWGVPDHITVSKAVDVLNAHPSSFFSTILLLSSHSPFEVPIKNKWSNASDIVNKYKSSVRYSDESMRLFFKAAIKTNWYKNTIFVITSDHGSTHSGWAGLEDHKRFRIPLLIFDPSAELKPNVIGLPCNHFDLPTTMMELVHGNSSPFIFGRNILSLTNDRAAYWNIDVAAGQYTLHDPKISLIGKKGLNKAEEPILFLDMVKLWYNQL